MKKLDVVFGYSDRKNECRMENYPESSLPQVGDQVIIQKEFVEVDDRIVVLDGEVIGRLWTYDYENDTCTVFICISSVRLHENS